MLGYMTKEQAKGHGFTHHGSYYGIPCWLGDPEGSMMVATKWAPLEYLMTVFHVIEGVMLATFFPEREPTFQFVVKGPIDA